MFTPLAKVNKLPLTVPADTLPAFILPLMPAPPVTVKAPVVVLALGVPLTIDKSCKLCGDVGEALLTVAPT